MHRPLPTPSPSVLPDFAALGVDRRILDGPLTRLLAANATRAAVLMVRGKLAWERYFHGAGPIDRFNTYSIAKAFTAAAIGLLEQEGALSIEDHACRFLPEWSHDGRRDIRIRHLLTMTSGLALQSERFKSAPDPTAAALAWPLMHRPGTVWAYEQAATHALVPIIVRASGKSPLELLRERILDPIGAGGIDWSRAPNGDCLGWRSTLASARDLASFGELLLARGRWHGHTLLDQTFVGRMLSVDPVTAAARADPPSHDLRRRSYGLLIYVNSAGIWPGVDRDAFALVGAFGNACLIDPRHDFVFVRLVTPESHTGQPEGFLNSLDAIDQGITRLWHIVLRAFVPPPRGFQRLLQHAYLSALDTLSAPPAR